MIHMETSLVLTAVSLESKRDLGTSLLRVKAGQDTVLRTLLYKRRNFTGLPYRITVEEFTSRISMLRNKLGNNGIKDEGLEVHVLADDEYSNSYPKTPVEILRIWYGGKYPEWLLSQWSRWSYREKKSST
ncbi:hypothetical protein RYX36_027311 [Vicia faba]